MNKKCRNCVWLERINAQTAYCMFKWCLYGNSREKDKRSDTLKSISFYDRSNKRFRQIDLDHFHKIDGKTEKPHVQEGYFHNGMASKPSDKDKRLIDKVMRKWYNK